MASAFAFDEARVASLDEQAQERFRPRIAEQTRPDSPSAASSAAMRGAAESSARGRFFADAEVAQHLGNFVMTLRSSLSGFPAFAHHLQHLDRGEDAVAGGVLCRGR